MLYIVAAFIVVGCISVAVASRVQPATKSSTNSTIATSIKRVSTTAVATLTPTAVTHPISVAPTQRQVAQATVPLQLAETLSLNQTPPVRSTVTERQQLTAITPTLAMQFLAKPQFDCIIAGAAAQLEQLSYLLGRGAPAKTGEIASLVCRVTNIHSAKAFFVMEYQLFKPDLPGFDDPFFVLELDGRRVLSRKAADSSASTVSRIAIPLHELSDHESCTVALRLYNTNDSFGIPEVSISSVAIELAGVSTHSMLDVSPPALVTDLQVFSEPQRRSQQTTQKTSQLTAQQFSLTFHAPADEQTFVAAYDIRVGLAGHPPQEMSQVFYEDYYFRQTPPQTAGSQEDLLVSIPDSIGSSEKLVLALRSQDIQGNWSPFAIAPLP